MGLILLNPGPVTLSDRVRRALLRPDLCHREPEFADLQGGIRAKLLALYDLDPAEWAAVLLTGSGTSAVEAMITSLVPPGTSLVVPHNGVYGERLARIARVHGIPCVPVEHGWEEPIDAERVAAAARGAGAGALAAAVHHETTTGRLNPVPPAGGPPLPWLLDAVSSFGAEPIAFGAGRVEACAATANKCLHGVPGAAFVIARRVRLGAAGAPRTVSLDLAAHCAAQDAGSTAFTQSVQAFYALDEALDELAQAGGWRGRRARYQVLSDGVRAELGALGIEPLVAESDGSAVLAAFRLPSGQGYAELHDALKRLGFVIYAGQGPLAGSVFRIAVMGDIADADLERLRAALRTTLGGRARGGAGGAARGSATGRPGGGFA